MKILGPGGSLDMAKAVLRAGADGIYVGMSSSFFERYSFNGRAQLNSHDDPTCLSEADVRELRQVSRGLGRELIFLVNNPMLNDGLDDENLYGRLLREQLELSLDIGADWVVLGDLGAIMIASEEFPEINISASSYLEISNLSELSFLADLGVKRAILPYNIRLEEIRALAAAKRTQIEVFGHGGCAFNVGHCNLFHCTGESGEGGVEVGFPCLNKYDVKRPEGEMKDVAIFDTYRVCGLCSVGTLADAGVDYLKIVGRYLEAKRILPMIEWYREAIDGHARGETKEEIYLKLVPGWYREIFCAKGRCRYTDHYRTQLPLAAQRARKESQPLVVLESRGES